MIKITSVCFSCHSWLTKPRNKSQECFGNGTNNSLQWVMFTFLGTEGLHFRQLSAKSQAQVGRDLATPRSKLGQLAQGFGQPWPAVGTALPNQPANSTRQELHRQLGQVGNKLWGIGCFAGADRPNCTVQPGPTGARIGVHST